MCGSWFSKPSDPPKTQGKVTEKDRAVLELKRQRDKLKMYKNQLENVILRERAVARQLVQQIQATSSADTKRLLKVRAELALKKKKFQEVLIERTEKQLFNLDELVNNLEFAVVEQQVFKALQSGTQSLQKLNSQMSLDDIDQLMSDSADAIRYQEEVSAMLSKELSPVDEESVRAELEQLEKAQQNVQDAPTTTTTDRLAAEHRLAAAVAALPTAATTEIAVTDATPVQPLKPIVLLTAS